MRLQVCEKSKKKDAPNHFFDALPCSSTSTTPARRGSIVGTWFARIPMSPVAAGTFTWMTSAELKIDCNHTIQHRPQSILHYSGLTWCGRASESLILSAASAYPRRPVAKDRGALRAAAETRRRADMTTCGPFSTTNSSMSWSPDGAGMLHDHMTQPTSPPDMAGMFVRWSCDSARQPTRDARKP